MTAGSLRNSEFADHVPGRQLPWQTIHLITGPTLTEISFLTSKTAAILHPYRLFGRMLHPFPVLCGRVGDGDHRICQYSRMPEDEQEQPHPDIDNIPVEIRREIAIWFLTPLCMPHRQTWQTGLPWKWTFMFKLGEILTI